MIVSFRKFSCSCSVLSLVGLTLSIIAAQPMSNFYSSSAFVEPTKEKSRPNILLIVADDIGFSDIAAFGSEVQTPNLDSLAKDGKIFTNWHVLPTCSPTRSELLTGVDSHLNGLGTMYEAITPNQKGKPGYEAYLNDRVITIADILKDAGYHTIMSGKWHLSKIGKPENGTYVSDPSSRGFEKSYTFLGGWGNHFSAKLLRGKFDSTFIKNGKVIDRPNGTYSSDLFTSELINSISKFQGDDKPLFMYLAFQATHTPLQAPASLIKRYLGKYDAGWDAIRKQRFERQKEYGIWPEKLQQLPERFPPASEWSSLTPAQQKYWSKVMATFAAMVDNMDYNIGKLIYYLKQTGEYNNTLIVFTSDNGGSEVFHGPAEGFNNTYANIGNPTSLIGYNETGSAVAVSPLSGFKGSMYEGGIRSPLIIKEPRGFSGSSSLDRSNLNQKPIRSFVHVLDMLPTILDYAGVPFPGSIYRGKDIYVPTMGYSIRPLLEGRLQKLHANDHPIAKELFGNSAVFMGDWKAMRHIQPAGDGIWELYNITNDPGEKNNLAKKNLDVLRKMVLAYDKYTRDFDIIPPDPKAFPAGMYGTLVNIYS
jgi:arylsulfatase A-like enzyme